MTAFVSGFIQNLCIIVATIHVAEMVVRSSSHSKYARWSRLFSVLLAILAGWLAIFYGVRWENQVFDLRLLPVVMIALCYPGAFIVALAATAIGAFRFIYGLNLAALTGFVSMAIIGLYFWLVSEWVARTRWSMLWKSFFLITTAVMLNSVLIVAFHSIEPAVYLTRILPLQYPMTLISGLFTALVFHESQIAREQRSSLIDAAYSDPLTGLYNRRHFSIYVAQLREQTHAMPLSVAYVDIDHFKSVNDTYGHSVGDVILKQVARILPRQLRSTDYIARVGGDEFVIVMPHCSREQAMRTLQRVRHAIDTAVFSVQNQTLKVSISIGVATSDYLDDHLMFQADAALYAAKKAGRNRVMAATETAENAFTDPASASSAGQ